MKEIQTILITGGTWFIWSHLTISLLEAWHRVIILDNLSNSSKSIVEKIKILTGKAPLFYEGDIRDKSVLANIFSNNTIDLVIHLAWLKSISESCQNISLYHNNNIIWSITLFEAMEKYNCRSIVFSSTGTVYSAENDFPLKEDSFIKPINPYSNSKLIIESVLQDFVSHASWKVISLRYFNPIGAHPSWLIWEDFKWKPNNLLPIIMRKIVGLDHTVMSIYWDNYSTSDWTCIRDYIHIMDLTSAHISAINYIEKMMDGSFDFFNIGTWAWVSVMEIIRMTQEITWASIRCEVQWRRNWDIPKIFCDPTKANAMLWWNAKYTYGDAIYDYWNFVKKDT